MKIFNNLKYTLLFDAIPLLFSLFYIYYAERLNSFQIILSFIVLLLININLFTKDHEMLDMINYFKKKK